MSRLNSWRRSSSRSRAVAAPARPDAATRLPWRRRLWPLAPALLLIPGFAPAFIEIWDASVVVDVLLALPVVLAVIVAALVVGGRAGVVTGLVLAALVTYWAWWFGWGVESNISPFSIDLAASGLIDATSYELGLLVNLWPIVLALVVVVALVARWRARSTWMSLGLLVLALIVLSLPSHASWDDSCNGLSGASPLITRPIAQPLMSAGIGVIPGGFQTAMLCEGVGDRQWKPFWLGGDGLPPGPRIGHIFPTVFELPTHLYREPRPLPGRAFTHLAIAHTQDDGLSVALIATRTLLPEPLPGERLDIRADGVRTDSEPGLISSGSRVRCYTALWHRRPNLPPDDPSRRVRITYEAKGRILAVGSTRVSHYRSEDEKGPFFRRFGCGG